MALTSHQQQKHDEIIALLRGGAKRIKLIGSAGTGKTFLCSEIIKTIMSDKTITQRMNNGKIYATAPTNKALAVLKGKIQLPVEFSTVHSAVKVTRNVNNKTGEESFIKKGGNSKFFEDEFRGCRLALIDECSMLERRFVGGHDTRYNAITQQSEKVYIEGWLEAYNFPIIFIGKSLPM